MNHLFLFNYLYLGSLLAAFLCSIYRYKTLDIGAKILSLLLLETFTAEVIAALFAIKHQNNVFIYNIQCIIYFSLISLYFNYTIDVFRKRNIGVIISLFGIIVGCLNIMYFQPLTIYNTYFIFFEGIMIISMALFYFFRMLINTEQFIIYKNAHFWFAVIFILLWNLSFINWGLLDYFMFRLQHMVWIISLSVLLINIFTYSALGFILLIYPKLKVANK